MNDVTRILSAIEQGDPQAAEQLLPLVYDELRKLAARKLAQEKPGQTLQATALVHEAYLRLVDVEQAQALEQPRPLLRRRGRGHAADPRRASARKKQRLKRGGDLQRVDLDDVEICVRGPPDDLLALDEALTELAQKHPEKAELVKLRYFAGLTVDEAAEVLGISAVNRRSPLDLRPGLALSRAVAGDAES